MLHIEGWPCQMRNGVNQAEDFGITMEPGFKGNIIAEVSLDGHIKIVSGTL